MLGLLFTPGAVVIAQVVLALPIEQAAAASLRVNAPLLPQIKRLPLAAQT
jgi:ABC-type tungstate transport system substrate-binding protein